MNEIHAQEFTKIVVLENTIEAQLIDSILNEQNIPQRFRSFFYTAYVGLFLLKKGWGEVFAPLALKEEILEIIEIVRSKNSDI